MNNLQPNSQMVECDDQTAELHMAMAEMVGEDEGDGSVKQGPGDQPNVMQFTMVQENTYGKQDQMYNYAKNYCSYYFTSFYNNKISDKEIYTVASNVMNVVETYPTLEQNIELAITKIFKNNPQIGTMEHQQFSQIS